MGPEKTQILAQNSLVLILPKISRLGQKLTKTLYFFIVTPILRIGYT
jgi:hypothetical protein